MEDILLDTDIIIEYLRAKDKPNTLFIDLIEKHNLFSTPITEFELFLGAKTIRHKKDIEMIFHEVQVLPFDLGCGEIAANIWKDLFYYPFPTKIQRILKRWRLECEQFMFLMIRKLNSHLIIKNLAL